MSVLVGVSKVKNNIWKGPFLAYLRMVADNLETFYIRENLQSLVAFSTIDSRKSQCVVFVKTSPFGCLFGIGSHFKYKLICFVLNLFKK